jgi:hypothetical protein
MEAEAKKIELHALEYSLPQHRHRELAARLFWV